ncbi:MAG: recombinase family protein [Candidatus Methylomirabilota bacterium]|jgi:DNA invertase Pin-like site-specific DNA recombinase
MRVVLYARVSTRDQDPETQLQDLRRYAAARGLEVVAEHVDVGVSGAQERRPGLDRVLALARAREIDAVLVAAFDRLGRNLRHFLLTLDELAHLGVTLISLREQFDLLSPIGRLVAGFLAGVAEFERALIRERIQAGVRRARERGTRSGRPIGRPRLVFHRDQVLVLRGQGLSHRAIARTLRVSRGTVGRLLKASQNPVAGFSDSEPIPRAFLGGLTPVPQPPPFAPAGLDAVTRIE